MTRDSGRLSEGRPGRVTDDVAGVVVAAPGDSVGRGDAVSRMQVVRDSHGADMKKGAGLSLSRCGSGLPIIQ